MSWPAVPPTPSGERQPLDAEPNLGGYANNGVHRVRVTVAEPARGVTSVSRA